MNILKACFWYSTGVHSLIKNLAHAFCYSLVLKSQTSVFLFLTLGGTSSLSDLAQDFWVGSGTSDLESELWFSTSLREGGYGSWERRWWCANLGEGSLKEWDRETGGTLFLRDARWDHCTLQKKKKHRTFNAFCTTDFSQLNTE